MFIATIRLNPSFMINLLLLLPVLILAKDQRSISARDLIGAASIRSVQISNNSQAIFYELRTTDFEKNTYRHRLWRLDLQDGTNHQLTYSQGNEWDPKINHAGACLAFLSDRPDLNGKEHTRLWVMPLSGGEAKPLTHAEHEVMDFVWDKQGTKLFYMTPERPPKQIKTWQEQRENQGFDVQDRTAEKPAIEIWCVDKYTGKSKRVFVGDPGVTSFSLSSSSDFIVYSTNYSGDPNDWLESDLYYFSIPDSTPPRKLIDRKGTEDAPLISPDDRLVAFMTLQERSKPFSQTEIELLELSTGKTRRLTKELDLGISDFSWFSKSTLKMEVMDGMSNHIYLTSISGEAFPVSGGEAYFFHSSSDPEGSAIAAVRQTAGSLSELVYVTAPGHPWQVLTHFSKSLDDISINPQTRFRWVSRDQRYKLEGLVVLPRYSGDQPLPLIVDIHGGPAGRTDIALEQFALYQAWASQGFAVFSPNFRGSEGYGAAFQTANFRDLGGGDYHDIMTGVDALIQRGVAHPDSLVIMGGSYGGYMTNWIITQTKRFKAAVSRYGIFDLKSDFSNSNFAQWELDYLGKPFWEDPAAYRRMSPSTFISRTKTPVLILHGADDENTFTSNSRELARALKTLDVPHRFFLYPREGHGMDEPNHRLDVFQRQLNWINDVLGRPMKTLGEDWIGAPVRVQVIGADRKATFLNKAGNFLRVTLLLDGSDLSVPMTFTLSEFRLAGGYVKPLGLPSGDFLTRLPDTPFTLDPEKSALTLDLVFPLVEQADATIVVPGVGSYDLNQH